MKTIRKNTPSKRKNEPAILSIFRKANLEQKQTEEMFQLLGWSSLPAELKFEIVDDVKGFYDELHGHYSTRCEYVLRRRESVDFWIKSFMDGLCSLQTAIDSLSVHKN